MAILQIGFSGVPDSSSAFTAVSYRTTSLASGSLIAQASGSCTKMFLYKTDTNSFIGSVAIYDQSLNLIVEQAVNFTGVIGWNEITIPSTSIVSGQTYYPTMLATTNTSAFGYDNTVGNGCSRLSGSVLPDPWLDPENRAYSPAVYLEYDGVAPTEATLTDFTAGQAEFESITASSDVLAYIEDTIAEPLEISIPNVAQDVSAILEDFITGQPEFEGVIASEDAIVGVSNFVAGQALFENITASGPASYTLNGVTYSKAGAILSDCQVSLFKHSGSGVYVFLDTVVSDTITGAYSFVVSDNDASYMIVAHKAGAPNVFDCSDNNLEPVIL